MNNVKRNALLEADSFPKTDRDAIAKVMRTFGWMPTEEELKDLVNVIDVDGNGDISFNEFVWLMTK